MIRVFSDDAIGCLVAVDVTVAESSLEDGRYASGVFGRSTRVPGGSGLAEKISTHIYKRRLDR